MRFLINDLQKTVLKFENAMVFLLTLSWTQTILKLNLYLNVFLNNMTNSAGDDSLDNSDYKPFFSLHET